MQDKARNKERTIEKVRFANFGEAAVNEHAGVQQFAVGGNRGRICAVTEQRGQRTGFQRAELARPERDSDIAEAEQDREFEEGFSRLRLRGSRDHCAYHKGRECFLFTAAAATEKS